MRRIFAIAVLVFVAGLTVPVVCVWARLGPVVYDRTDFYEDEHETGQAIRIPSLQNNT